MHTVRAFFVRWKRGASNTKGQGLVEYGLILGLIAIVVIAALNSTGTSVNALIQKVASSLSTVGTPQSQPPRQTAPPAGGASGGPQTN